MQPERWPDAQICVCLEKTGNIIMTTENWSKKLRLGGAGDEKPQETMQNSTYISASS